MTEVIHEHQSGSDSGSNGLILLVGVLVAVGIFLFFFYNIGRGMLNGGTGTNAPQINIPDKVNIDVNQK